MTSYMDYTSPNTQFTFDVNTNTLFKKDANNYINLLSVKQLNTLENTSLLDIFLANRMWWSLIIIKMRQSLSIVSAVQQ